MFENGLLAEHMFPIGNVIWSDLIANAPIKRLQLHAREKTVVSIKRSYGNLIRLSYKIFYHGCWHRRCFNEKPAYTINFSQ
jgi:hypothetical protein